MTRQEALDVLRTLPRDALEAFAIVAETAEVQGGYVSTDDGSTWTDSANETLSRLAAEVRGLSR